MKASLRSRKLTYNFKWDSFPFGPSPKFRTLVLVPSPLSLIDYKIVSPEWTVTGCQHSRRPMVKVIFMKLSVKHATKKVFQKYLKSEDVFLGGTESWSPPSWSTKWVTIQKWLSLTEVISSQPQIESLLVLLLLLELMNNEVLVSFLLNIRVKNVLILWLFRLCK